MDTATTMAMAETEYSRVKTSVWWDVENCEVPRGWNAYAIAQNVASALLKMDYGGPVSISAYGDTNLIPHDVQQALSSTGVALNHVPAGVKDASDKKILVDMCLWAVDNPAPANFMLISGDRDFSYALHQLRMRRYNILLAQPPHASVPLVAAAKYVWLWTSLASGGPPLTTAESLNNGRTLLSDNQHPVSEEAPFCKPDSTSDPGGDTKDLKASENHIPGGLPQKTRKNMPQSGRKATCESFNAHLSDEMHMSQAEFVASRKAHVSVSAKPVKEAGLVEPVFCQVCLISCSSKETYAMHTYGKRHRNNLELQSGKNMSGRPVELPQENLEKQKKKASDGRTKQNADYVCRLCNVACQTPIAFESHLRGRKHAATLSQTEALTDSVKLEDKGVGEKDLPKEIIGKPQLHSQNVEKNSKFFEKHVVIVNQSEELNDYKKLQEECVEEKYQPRETIAKPRLRSPNTSENNKSFKNNGDMVNQSEALINSMKHKEEVIQEKAIKIDTIQEPQSQPRNTLDHTKFIEKQTEDLKEKCVSSESFVKEPFPGTKDRVECANKQLPSGKIIFGDLRCAFEVPEETGECFDGIVKPVNLSKGAIDHSAEVVKKKKEVVVRQERALANVSAKSIQETELSEPILCQVCQISCTSKETYTNHTYGKRHRKNLELQSSKSGQMPGGLVDPPKQAMEKLKIKASAKQNADYVCRLCNVACQTPIVFDSHLKGQKHAAMMSQSGALIDTKKLQEKGGKEKDQLRETLSEPKSKFDHTCRLCNVVCNSQIFFDYHLRGQKHAAMLSQSGLDQAGLKGVGEKDGEPQLQSRNTPESSTCFEKHVAMVNQSEALSSSRKLEEKGAQEKAQPIETTIEPQSQSQDHTKFFEKHRDTKSGTSTSIVKEPFPSTKVGAETVDKHIPYGKFICGDLICLFEVPEETRECFAGIVKPLNLSKGATEHSGEMTTKEKEATFVTSDDAQSSVSTNHTKQADVLQPVWCQVCQISCNNKVAYSNHTYGQKHRQNQELQSTKIENMCKNHSAALDFNLKNQNHADVVKAQAESLCSWNTRSDQDIDKTEEHALEKIDDLWFQGTPANNKKLKERNLISESSERVFPELKRESLLHKESKHPLDLTPESLKLPPVVDVTEKLRDESNHKPVPKSGELENESAGVGKEEIKGQADNFWTRLWGKKC